MIELLQKEMGCKVNKKVYSINPKEYEDSLYNIPRNEFYSYINKIVEEFNEYMYNIYNRLIEIEKIKALDIRTKEIIEYKKKPYFSNQIGNLALLSVYDSNYIIKIYKFINETNQETIEEVYNIKENQDDILSIYNIKTEQAIKLLKRFL